MKTIPERALAHLRSEADRMVELDSPVSKTEFWLDLQSALNELDARRKGEAVNELLAVGYVKKHALIHAQQGGARFCALYPKAEVGAKDLITLYAKVGK